jgi:hypothetical protein
MNTEAQTLEKPAAEQIKEPVKETVSISKFIAGIGAMDTKSLKEYVTVKPEKKPSEPKPGEGSEATKEEPKPAAKDDKKKDEFVFEKDKYSKLSPEEMLSELEKTQKENFHKDKLNGKLTGEVFDARKSKEIIAGLKQQLELQKNKLLTDDQIAELPDEIQRQEAVVERKDAKKQIKALDNEIVSLEVKEKNREQLLQIVPKFEENLGGIYTMIAEDEGKELAESFKNNLFSFPAVALLQVHKRYESKAKIDSLQKELDAEKKKNEQLINNAKQVTEKIKNHVVDRLPNSASDTTVTEGKKINIYDISLMSTKDLKALKK